MEPAIDGPLPIPSLYTQKSYENQLPPLRPPSSSPQNNLHSQLTPNGTLKPVYSTAILVINIDPGIHPIMEFPTSMAPMRGYTATTSQQHPMGGHDERLRDFGTPEDQILDPVSALLRAGEIVNRNSQNRP
jgi:hypothetical protein